MPELAVFFKLLESYGWVLNQDRWVAPGGTIWLYKDSPWPGEASEFLIEMQMRVERIGNFESNEQQDVSSTTSDTLNDSMQLVDALNWFLKSAS